MSVSDSKSKTENVYLEVEPDLDLDLARSLKSITERLEKIEARLDVSTSDSRPCSSQEPLAQTEDQGPDPNQLGSVECDNALLDIQRQFDSLRDRLSRVQIPWYCKVNDSAVGIKTDCKPVLKVISKSARFAETGLKILGNLPQDIQGQYTLAENDIQSLNTVFYAQINYLQGEYSNLVVRSTFDDETSRLFRSIENNTQAFSDRSLTNVRLAAELSALSTRTSSRPSSSRNNYRGRRQPFNPTNSRRPQHQFYILQSQRLRGLHILPPLDGSESGLSLYPTGRRVGIHPSASLGYIQRPNTVSHHLLSLDPSRKQPCSCRPIRLWVVYCLQKNCLEPSTCYYHYQPCRARLDCQRCTNSILLPSSAFSN